MKKYSLFNIGVIGIFIFLAIIGLIVFSSYRASSPSDEIGEITIWGTYNDQVFDTFLSQMQDDNAQLDGVRYRYISPDDFDYQLLEALASGQSPDLLFIEDSQLLSHLNKIFILESSTYPVSIFQDNFVELAEIYLLDGGIVGVPLAADPLVMFWNRDMFSSAGLVRPPQAWSDFAGISNKLSIVSESRNITRSTIAFGEAQNVDYFREILATLILQQGNPITQKQGDSIVPVLAGSDSFESAEQALRFFTSFSDASRDEYSWNRALPASEQAFLSGKLAVYFAPASRVVSLRQKNPNLNFSVAEIPAVDANTAGAKRVHATLRGFVIPKQSNNISGAFSVMNILTNDAGGRLFAELSYTAPVRKNLVTEESNETYQDILKREAIYARTFLDRDKQQTNNIFKNMVESITSGRQSVTQAITISNAALYDVLE